MARAKEPVVVSVDRISEDIEKTIRELDQARAAGLETLATMHGAMMGGFERDRQRLVQKLGADHPRVAGLTRTLESGRAVARELRIEQLTAAVAPPDVDEKSRALHGRVLDAKREPQKGLTVVLSRANAYQRQFGGAATDATGYFVLKMPGPDDPAREPLVVHVLRDRRVIHVDDRAVSVELGHSEYREIVLGEEPETPTPPRDKKKDEAPAAEER